MIVTTFDKKVRKALSYYVYRLIDPRTGNTFYVGKGKGNRVFAHVNCALRKYKGKNYLEKNEDDISTKIKQIQEIRNQGLEVIMVIHRWGMDNNTAYEVESALIDCYPGLTNIQSGHGNDRGVANVETIQRILGLKEFDDSRAANNEYMIIKIREDVLDSHDGDVYATAKSAWHIDPTKARLYRYILVSLNGEIIAVYKNALWSPSVAEPDRWEFNAKPADRINDSVIIDRYFNKLLPKRYMKKGLAAPVLYQQ